MADKTFKEEHVKSFDDRFLFLLFLPFFLLFIVFLIIVAGHGLHHLDMLLLFVYMQLNHVHFGKPLYDVPEKHILEVIVGRCVQLL